MIRYVPAVVVVAALGAAPTAGGEPRPFVDSGVTAETTILLHDASSINPVLGSPTSILNYDYLVSPWLRAGVRGDDSAGFYELSASVSGTLLGKLQDLDYFAGNLLFSDTTSTSSGFGFDLQGRFSVPGVTATLLDGTITPYAGLSASFRRLTNSGAACGLVCAAGTQPAGVAIIGQDFSAGALRLGAEWAWTPESSDRLILAGEVRGGAMHVADSHFLRTDLGPIPNINYRFATIGADISARYRHLISSALAVTATASGNLTVGRGEIVYGAQTSTPTAPLPAAYVSASVSVSLGLVGSF